MTKSDRERRRSRPSTIDSKTTKEASLMTSSITIRSMQETRPSRLRKSTIEESNLRRSCVKPKTLETETGMNSSLPRTS